MAGQVYQFARPEECCWGPGAVTFANKLPASATRDAEPPTGPKDTLVEVKSICPTPQISMSPVLLNHPLQNNLIFNQDSRTSQYTSLIQTVNCKLWVSSSNSSLPIVTKVRSARLVGLLGWARTISLCYATIVRNTAGDRNLQYSVKQTPPNGWQLTSWVLTFGRDATWLYAAHSSGHTTVPGATWCWMIGSKVVASLFGTICTYPKAGSTEVSAIPSTHSCDLEGRPQWP